MASWGVCTWIEHKLFKFCIQPLPSVIFELSSFHKKISGMMIVSKLIIKNRVIFLQLPFFLLKIEHDILKAFGRL